MSHSTFVGGILLAGFVLYLAAKDRLTVYENVLWGAKPAPASSGSGSGLAGTAAKGAAVGADILSGNIPGAASKLFSFL